MKRAMLLALVMTLGMATKAARADFTFGEPTNLGLTVNSSSVDYGNCVSDDGLDMYLSSYRSGGYGDVDIWVTTRSTVDSEWSIPVNLGPTLNSPAWDSCPNISVDGLSIFFESQRAGGVGDNDIWMTSRSTPYGDWEPPVNLGPTLNSPVWDSCPSISADDLSLYFCSFRSGGSGNCDLWVVTRATVSDPWGQPVNLGPAVNSSAYEYHPDISTDGLALFFHSDRSGGSGSNDIWVTRRATVSDPWGQPVNLGPKVNSSAQEIAPDISSDCCMLYFSSNRTGGVGNTDLYQAPIIPIVDLNNDGIVDSADMCIIVDSWGTDNSLCDIGPMPWGDGIVDVQDLIVVANHLFEDYRLIHHWKLDEDSGSIAHDSVGSIDATLHGAPHWQPFDGVIDGALAFDGQKDYLTTPFILDPAAGSFSVFAWVKGTERGKAIISQNDSSGFSNLWLGTNASNGSLITRLMHPPFSPLTSRAVITDGQWHHIGLVYDFLKLHRYLYLNGVEVATDTEAAGGVQLDGGLFIGVGEGMNPATFWSGMIDDIRVYNNALDAEEVEALAK